MMARHVMGWDIGGAHLKAAIVESPSNVQAIYQRPCPLWKGIDLLENAVREILAEATGQIDCHVLTMTGELVDLFENREEGVMRILQTMRSLLKNAQLTVYAGKDGFLAIDGVQPCHFPSIASANWLASSTLAAQKVEDGLFVDIGSTTTDILLLHQGKVAAQGYTDYERLLSQELVYTGIIRTAVMSVSPFAEDQGKRIGLMAEYFATMADVYRLTGELDGLHDQSDTADGAEKTVEASAKRLARMVGCDFFTNELPRWRQFACNLRFQQLRRLQDACLRQMSRFNLSNNAGFVGAGVGRFLVKEIAGNLGHPYIDFNQLVGSPKAPSRFSEADCAPAVAVGGLYASALYLT